MDDVDRGLELLTFQDVRPENEAKGDKIGEAVFTTSDGMVVTVTISHADKDVWARFAVTGGDKTKTEADKLSARLANWSYQVGSWKEKSLVPTLDDLQAPPPTKPAAAPDVPPAAAKP